MDLGRQCVNRLQPDRRARDENAAVPPVVARLQVALGERRVGFLDEASDRITALAAVARPRLADPDIAVARFRTARQHTERDDRAFLRVTCRARDRILERADIGDHVIGRHHREHGVVLEFAGVERGKRERRCRIARGGFEQDSGGRRTVDHLRGAHDAMLFAAHQQQCRPAPRSRCRSGDASRTAAIRSRSARSAASETVRATAARARAGTSGEDDRQDAWKVGCGNRA